MVCNEEPFQRSGGLPYVLARMGGRVTNQQRARVLPCDPNTESFRTMRDYSRLTKAELIERLTKSNQEHKGDRRLNRGANEIQAEAALHDTEERMRAILQTAVEGIITIDEKATIESLNPA